MSLKLKLLFAIAGAGLAALAATAPTQALTMRECVEKYKAARSAGTLKGTQGEWVDFRKAECGTDATPAAAPPAPAAPKAAK
jgi:hypothetical protein